MGAAPSCLAVRRGELEGTRYHLESEQETNRIEVAGRRYRLKDGKKQAVGHYGAQNPPLLRGALPLEDLSYSRH